MPSVLPESTIKQGKTSFIRAVLKVSLNAPKCFPLDDTKNRKARTAISKSQIVLLRSRNDRLRVGLVSRGAES